MDLFTSYSLGPLSLKNRAVMAPLTRSRAIGNVPNRLMAEYYAQRAGAGLIISEGIAPSPDGLGYPRIPGLFTDDQVAGWKAVTGAVHAAGGSMFAQLMHTGRIGHPLNMAPDAQILAPSAVAAAGEMFTDQEGPRPHPRPRAMTAKDIAATREQYVAAARNAIAAGFDGVEMHAANGYLLEQFLNPGTNRRTDSYGGSIAGRTRFVVETVAAVADAIGADRVGVRVSPYSAFNDMPAYDEVDATYARLAAEFDRIGVVYLHYLRNAIGGDRIPPATLRALRDNYSGTLIANGGFDRADAERSLEAGEADLVSFGVPFLANPDLIVRMKKGLELNRPRPDTFYSPGPEGYVDYPELEAA